MKKRSSITAVTCCIVWVIALLFLGIALTFLLRWDTRLGVPSHTLFGAPLSLVAVGVSVWLIVVGVGLWYARRWGVILYAIFGIVGIAVYLITFIRDADWGKALLWAFFVLPHTRLVVSLWRETGMR